MRIYYTNNYTGDKDESHRLLEAAIAAEIGDVAKAASLIRSMKTTESGKPYISGFREFSISHSGNTWAVLFADKACGLDIQYIKDCDTVKIAERWFSADEFEAVRQAGEEEDKVFTGIWTRREAMVKAAGTSIVNSKLPGTLDSEVSYQGVLWQIRDIRIPDTDCIAALCSTEIENIRYIELG